MADLEYAHQLIEDCLAQKRNAQYRLYQKYSQAMYNVCLRLMPSQAEAEDMLQVAFIDVFKKLEQYRFQSTPGAWIKRIVVNKCITELNKRKIDLSPLDDNYEVEETIEAQREYLQVETVKQAIHKLADGYRVILSMYLLEGYDHKEISEILNISESTSKSQYSRAKKKLKTLLLSKQMIKRK